MFKRLLAHLLDTWTFVIMSDARSRIFQIKIPKALGYFLPMLILGLGTGLYVTYQEANSLGLRTSQLKEEIADKKEELTTLQDHYQEIASRTEETEEKIRQLASIQGAMNQLAEAAKSNETLAIGGSAEFTNFTPEDGIANDEVSELSTIQENIPTLVQNYEQTISDLQAVQEELASIPSIWPTEARRITSVFGNRIHPVTGRTSSHDGLDIAGPYASEIYAAADGRVTFADYNGTYGNMVRINHPGEYQTSYGHMTRLHVESGDVVEKGDLIGEMGTTGRSTGVHLHYEVHKNGRAVDPVPYVFIDQ
ncbi:peptidoglycan DD-metalloendopeptidase family protein [Halobacillus litoralis]|uniref:M23 family metallopeptidase n=1 Tax=Halobacillus litoralis TaxID=45668 RepID=UPI001CD5E71F|nr:peptidoglycan DD-metalloendopeptidase family protein [Halobacillus litoralis]MCA0972048.1 peptidoglycan DD-metalloendopeptidase family protein [Halobacillus litoralis]